MSSDRAVTYCGVGQSDLPRLTGVRAGGPAGWQDSGHCNTDSKIHR